MCRSSLLLLLLLAPILSCGEGEPSGPPAPPPASPPVPASVDVEPASLTLGALGTTVQLTARVRDQHRQPLEDVAVVWHSSTPSIATVDSAGRVTAVDNGKATITVSAGDATGEVLATVLQRAATLELSPPDTIRTYGDTARVAVRAADANGHPMGSRLLTWSSGDIGIITVDSTGLVTGTGNGTASVSAWSGSFRVSADVTVYDLDGARKTDREALIVLFNGGRSHVWPRKENWGTEAPLSTWAGVSTDEEGRVKALSMPGNEVWGDLPPELGKLDRIETIDLSNNRLHGRLPPELGRLARIETLDLSRNRFSFRSGIPIPIPREFGKLANLKILDLRYMSVEAIPAELFDLTNLEVLRLPAPDSIPPELAKLSKLRVLDLSLSGPASGGTPIPPELGNLANLEVLNLGGSNLSGGVPPELGKLVKLDTLYLFESGVGGRLPSELGNLTNLRSLTLGNRARGWPYPSNDWPNNTPRVGGVWEILVTLAERNSRLEELVVHRGAGGPIPPEIAKLRQLRKLEWTFSELPGQIPPELGDLTHLEVLDLSRNALTGLLPPELGTLANLEVLDLSLNALTGSIPPEIGNLARLDMLILTDNELTGPVPPELGNLAQLRWLSLRDNNLDGPLPLALTRLTGLEILTINRTGLCVPNEPAFEVWLAQIESFTGARCH